MTRHGVCSECGHIIAEESTKQGTMLTCLIGTGGCNKRWWIDED